MNQLNSSISNSNHANARHVGSAIYAVAWVLVGLVAIDFAIDFLFAYPSDPRTRPSFLQAYFEYGRSTEGQLARMTRPEKSQTAPITLSGWYDPLEVREFSPKNPKNPIVTIYGMSHAGRLANALARTSNRFTPRAVTAPGSTSNWAYGAYLRDRGGGKSYAVVLAFMSELLPMNSTLSPMTWNIDSPMPYTADRFFLDANRLQVIHPPYTSFEQYAATFFDREKWAAARDFFAKNDRVYNSLIFRTNILDHASLVRLVRRAYGQRYLRTVRKAVLDETGYNPNSEEINVARAIIHEFALGARSEGIMPVIFMVNNLGFSNYLYQALSPILHADNIPYLSSDAIVSPNNPRGYLPDSHFTDAVDDELARALVKVIENQSAKPLRNGSVD